MAALAPSEQEDELAEGVYNPISDFRDEYFSTPQVSAELAGTIDNPNSWGPHHITNREDRQSFAIPGIPEEYHPVPSPEHRRPDP